MSPPGNANGGHPRPGPAIAELINTELDPPAEASHLHLTGNKADLTSAEVIGRDQRRKHPTVVVRVCPKCRATHLHRALGERKAPCGRTYILVAGEAGAMAA